MVISWFRLCDSSSVLSRHWDNQWLTWRKHGFGQLRHFFICDRERCFSESILWSVGMSRLYSMASVLISVFALSCLTSACAKTSTTDTSIGANSIPDSPLHGPCYLNKSSNSISIRPSSKSVELVAIFKSGNLKAGADSYMFIASGEYPACITATASGRNAAGQTTLTFSLVSGISSTQLSYLQSALEGSDYFSSVTTQQPSVT